jgi:hypothetical protein
MSRPPQSPVLIVYERHPQWTPLLRRELDAEAKLLAAGSLDHCWVELAARPGSAVLLQLTGRNWARVIQDLGHIRFRDAQSLFLAAVSQLARPVRARLGQAGFLYQLVTPLDVPGAVRMVRRHLRQQTGPTQSIEERIWNNLPWSQY